jgi:activator of the mannose operon (transcriptional antiterminator)
VLRAFPDWTIVGVVSASSLHTLQPQDNIELVISTINLPEIALPVVYVSAFFNDADIRRVTEKIVTDKLHHAAISAVDNEILYP